MLKGKQQSKYDDIYIEYQCERCWSNKDINLYLKSLFLEEGTKGFVMLCERCNVEAPSGIGKEIFEDLFLEFSSPKELIQHYNVKNEREAMELWCNEHGMEISDIDTKTISDSKSAITIENEELQIPFGYETKERRLSVNREEEDIVRSIFEKYLSGKTMEWIARNLDQDKKFNVGIIRQILKNPVYAGYVLKGNEYIRGSHEPLIDRETFNDVQQKIVRNIRNPKYLYKPLILGE